MDTFGLTVDDIRVALGALEDATFKGKDCAAAAAMIVRFRSAQKAMQAPKLAPPESVDEQQVQTVTK